MMNERSYPARVAGYTHPEAFCLMRYQTKDGLLTEVLWNSRDGVTPFGIRSTDGREMLHVDWHRDRFVPDYKPTPGQRIFVTLSKERATELARERVATWWDDREYPMSQRFDTQDEAITALADSYWNGGHAPTIVTVREDGTWL
jgi:hypothetical protein